ncbi:MAG TPA: N-acetylmuramoyl-L-alanine amidase [Stellaceae bacterium]|nr:N-acetylmuramoyl-L-alanine amidase [Stellaceae bacterium]
MGTGEIRPTRRVVLRLLAGGTAVGASLPAAAAKKRPTPHLPIIALDPGHGGSDPGAISPHRVYEKRITLTVGVELARQLAATHRFRPMLTRHSDVFVPLQGRVARARSWRADAFLSLHADILPDPAVKGILAFTLSERASDREAAAFAHRENRGERIAGLDLSRQPRDVGAVLLDLARRQTADRSLALGQAVIAELGREAALVEKPLRSAGFVVLTAPDIPSVLVELGCLSNPEEERLLQQRDYQRRLAAALVRAVEAYWSRSTVI